MKQTTNKQTKADEPLKTIFVQYHCERNHMMYCYNLLTNFNQTH